MVAHSSRKLPTRDAEEEVPITFEVTGSWLGRPPQWTKLPCSGYNNGQTPARYTTPPANAATTHPPLAEGTQN